MVAEVYGGREEGCCGGCLRLRRWGFWGGDGGERVGWVCVCFGLLVWGNCSEALGLVLFFLFVRSIYLRVSHLRFSTPIRPGGSFFS